MAIKQRVRQSESKRHNAGSEKKPSMKTADDVIKRVLWDDDVPSTAFNVGYEDRFLGIMEKPFSAFNWCDFASLSDKETAIPQHRIVFFKYRDVIVWDKRTRCDNVFGSVGGETLDHVIQNYEHYAPRVPIEQPLQPAIEHAQELADVERRNEVDLSDENRPNYFVCLRITDASLVAALRQVQCRLLEADPRLHEALLPANKFHITLTTLRLNSEEEKQAACEVLSEARSLLARVLPSSSAARVQGVGCFRDRVLHAQLAPACQYVLAAAVASLNSLFAARGLKLAGMQQRDFTAHITLAKLSRQLSRHVGRIEPAAYAAFGAETELGAQVAEGLDLCEMGPQTGADGFYVRLCPTVSNSAPEPFVEASNAKLHALVAPDTAKRVVIMRGLPGSGKSAVAQQLVQSAGAERAGVCSADAFFEAEEGGYAFSAEQLGAAHAACWERFEGMAGRGTEVIVVDNTNATQPEVQRYVEAAAQRGYLVSVVETVCCGTADLLAFHHRGTHRVPWSALLRMLARWVPCHGAWLVDTRPRPRLSTPQHLPALSEQAARLSEAREAAQAGQEAGGACEAEEAEEAEAPWGGLTEERSRRRGSVWQRGSGGEGGEEVRRLAVFDMDGTLLATAGRAEGVPAWEAAHNRPYPHPSWLDRPESLSLPASISPGPVLPLWPLCAGRGGTRTVVLTGRVETLREVAERVLAEQLPGGVGPDRLVMKPAGCALSTGAWKAAALRELMAECGAGLEAVTVWDDDQRNLAALAKVRDAEACREGGVRVQLVDAVAAGLLLLAPPRPSEAPPSQPPTARGPVEAFVRARGLVLSGEAAENGAQAAELVAGAWRSLLLAKRQLPPATPALSLARLFGSRRLRRAGDVDVCLLAPKSWNAERCMDELRQAACDMGLGRVYVARSKRCPRVRLQVPFSNSAPVDLDIVFAPLLAPGHNPPSLDAAADAAFRPRALNSGGEEGCDGVAFAEHVASTLKEKGVRAEAVGMAAEVGLGVLRARGVPGGSAWGGLRACHLLHVARAAIAEAEPRAPVHAPEDVLRLLVRKAARMSVEEWQQLTNGFVPAVWVSALPALWARAAQELLGAGGAVTAEGLEQATRREAEEGERWSVRVRVEGGWEARWRGGLRLQSKLPLAFHAALLEGADVQPGTCSDTTVWMRCGGDERTRKTVMAKMEWLRDEVLRTAEGEEEIHIDVQMTRC